MKKALIYSTILAPLLALMLISIHVYVIFKTPYDGEKTFFQIKDGETFSSINQRLYENRIISNARVFHHYTKYKGLLEKFKVGTFEIDHGMKMEDVLQTLVFGTPLLNTVTIPEGKNLYEVAIILEKANFGAKEVFINLAKDPSLISDIAPDAVSLEGYLFPDTYKFAPGTSPETIIKSMVDLFRRKTQDLSSPHSYLDFHEMIILASIVEKETGAKSERPTIAGVFHNRLLKRMRLQSDPTTIYGIWERYKGNIKKSDLLEETPYNTYKIPSLPVGPISNPSLEAIKAVISPEQHHYLFFVSKNDGTHVFTEKYSDHSSAVNDYQKNSKNRQGKSWRNLKQ
jgi:UPF0755 protein